MQMEGLFSASKRAYFGKSIMVHMGGVSRYFSQVFWKGSMRLCSFYGRPNVIKCRCWEEVHSACPMRVPNLDTKYDQTKVPPYNGNDPCPPLVV